ESGLARGRPGADRDAWRGVRAGGRGDGRGRAATLRRRHRSRDHRHRRTGWGHGGKAGGHGLFQRDGGSPRFNGPHGYPHAAASRQPVGYPGALDDGGHAPAASPAERHRLVHLTSVAGKALSVVPKRIPVASLPISVSTVTAINTGTIVAANADG